MKYKSGQSWLGRICRHRRGELNLTIKRIAEIAGYESPNMISYIELGTQAIAEDRLEGLARAYQLNLRDFRLAWIVAGLFDAHIPTDEIAFLFDRDDLWGRAQPPTGSDHDDPAGPPGDPPRPDGPVGGVHIDARPFIRAQRAIRAPGRDSDEVVFLSETRSARIAAACLVKSAAAVVVAAALATCLAFSPLQAGALPVSDNM